MDFFNGLEVLKYLEHLSTSILLNFYHDSAY